MLEIYNSLTKSKEEFKPIEEGKIRMYVCGMTVYDYCHIGHARVLVVFDVIVRYLRLLNYEVTYVRNITDIDDKIIVRALENKEDFMLLTERFIKAMHEDCEALNVLPPDIEPRATDSMADIISMISKLEKNGYSYTANNGDVYYDVKKFKEYGKLSGRKLEDQIAGKRVEVDAAKKNPEDFVLWKMAKVDEPSWDSPWGKGRPGWHIECSAMSTQCLGDQFDIHGGGMDLKFPHHENEIAQTEACTGKTSVNYWIHNGFVQVDETKMSKSLGNFFTVREVLKNYRAEEIRYFILNSHYRSPLNYSSDNLDAAKSALANMYNTLRGIKTDKFDGILKNRYSERFVKAMNDDFNTAGAISILFEITHEINRLNSGSKSEAQELAAQLKYLASILGILQEDPEVYLQGGVNALDGLETKEIDKLIQQRIEARISKDFKEADRIRDVLTAKGIVLEDKAGDTIWRKE